MKRKVALYVHDILQNMQDAEELPRTSGDSPAHEKPILRKIAKC